MLFATPATAKPEKVWQRETCLQNCIKIQIIMHQRQATSMTRSTTQFGWSDIRISCRTKIPDH